jgi:alpha-beta hydrolase superfamily lysophospholipase
VSDAIEAASRQKMMLKKNLIKAGSLLLLTFGFLMMGLYVLHQSRMIKAWQLPVGPIATFLLGGGLACFCLVLYLGNHRQRNVLGTLLAFIIIVNVLAYAGAYAFTHFLISGRPNSTKIPIEMGLEYEVDRIHINQDEWLETWLIPSQDPQGTIVLFPGSGGSKGKQLLPASKVFNALGYNALLVDFRGVGGSSGNTTTIGANEAQDVVWVMNAVQQENLQTPIILYGVSMGSAAILRAIAHYDIVPDAIILELPFVRLLDTVRSRLREFKFPQFPLAELLVFWGGIQHGFDGFSHNPITYAERVKCPVLIFHGQQDKWTSIKEINELFQKIRTPKQLVIFQDSGHQLLVTVDEMLWQKSITHFLESVAGRNPE